MSYYRNSSTEAGCFFGLFVFLIILSLVSSALEIPIWAVLVLLVVLLVIIGFVVSKFASSSINVTICPNCDTPTRFQYLHERVNGGPDRRYKYNPIVCMNCGYKFSSMEEINQMRFRKNHVETIPKPCTPTPTRLELEERRAERLRELHEDSHRRMEILRRKWGESDHPGIADVESKDNSAC